jgi:ABC-type multidrug transport system fused ATPase/permease subunit
LIYEPLGSLSALGALSIASITFYRVVRKRTSHYGAIRQVHERLRVQHLQQGLGGVKDVKLLGREDDFLTQYEFHNKMSAKMLRIVKTLNQFPRLWLEFLSICGLGIIMFVVSYNSADKTSIIPVIGLFAAAAFRLIPSFNRILNSLQSYRFGLPVIDTMYNELKLNIQTKPIASEAANFSFGKEIQISGLSFNYPDTKKKTLDNISFSVRKFYCK